MSYVMKRTGTKSNDITSYSHLLNNVFGDMDKFSVQSLKWRYQDNPEGTVFGYDAYHDDVLAAHYVTVPLKAIVNGKVKKGLLSLNTATHAEHRGQGLFPKLANATYDAASNEGYDFIVGVANAQSTPGFIKKLGFQLVAPLKVGLTLSKNWIHSGDSFAPIHSESWMSWRLKNPSAIYRQKKRTGSIKISAQTHIPFVNCCAYLPEQTIVLEQQRGLSLNLFLGLAAQENFSGGKFIPLPERIKKSPLNLIFKPLKGDEKIDPENVQFNFLDSDSF